ncbi:MAG: alpha/beta fold hydrolase [Oscillospiraceae bacterium]|nr:alpha/beta fold hydrolase [Oscillospiraceae bacterium]
MKTETFDFAGYNGTNLPACLWMPDGEVKAVLQITHGMTEHMGRYEAFAEYLCPMGIAVAGFDLRGHGRNPGDAEVASFGEGGWAASIEDMQLFYELLEQQLPGVPHYMLGFSLGSFLLREYLTKHPDEGGIAGAIIMGTGHQPGWLLTIMRWIVKDQIKKAGFDKTTDLVRQLSFGAYNQKFKPNRTAADWLCADEVELGKYLEDPLVRRDISAGLFWELLGSMKRTGKKTTYEEWNKKMPVLLLYGENDPVGDFGKGVQRLYDQMRKAGIQIITFQRFLDARHDLLHEEATRAESVRHCITDWLIYNE